MSAAANEAARPAAMSKQDATLQARAALVGLQTWPHGEGEFVVSRWGLHRIVGRQQLQDIVESLERHRGA